MYSLVDPITKETVLNRVSQEDIFKRYLGIDVVLNTLVKSPLRDDSNPTCSFYYSKGTLYFRDFSGHFWGDCFSLVMRLENVSFYGALTKIYYDMSPTERPKLTIKKDTSHTVLVKKRKWNKHDLDYWGKFNYTESLLDFYDIAPCQEVWVSKNGRTRLKYSYTKNNPAYSYFFEIGNYKIYMPFTKQFYMVKGYIEGYNQLPSDGSKLIITKSLKDVGCLRSFGILSVSLSGESVNLHADKYKELKRRFRRLYSLYDYDYAGIRAANKLKKEYGIIPLFIPYKCKLFGKPDFKVKDISEFVEHYGVLKTRKLIDAVSESDMNINELYNYING